ncbi:ThuA domain-containing protein [Galbibacter sp. PAP.153]|uniref:ThuA domain-containing protein n=1 Tax=Galbibacter sp. PAP.153 TaxID=3104623 RepID=UPI0030098B3C
MISLKPTCKVFFILFLNCFLFCTAQDSEKDNTGKVPQEEQVLVFTKTNGYRHKSIETGVELIKKLGNENNFKVVHTEDSLQFNTSNLSKYKVVLFLSTTMDVLGDEQQQAFKKYIQNGGSFMGIHAASDTEYGWPWYGKLVGAYFVSHPNNPNVRKATIQILDKSHVSTQMLPGKTWKRNDEWYNFKDINPDIHVLLNLDENSYDGGENGEHHPIAWYHEFDGGRAFYTGGGHTIESYSEPLFVAHVLGGLTYCLGRD